jgi:CelD/BcsL family acetyltransferase involved in cellulose biosynthesis
VTTIHVDILHDPIGDSRWSQLLVQHPAASVFHSPGWLSALRMTYGYEPFVVTTSAGPALTNGVVLCGVKGWTSRRLVSLPFSDHCDPLIAQSEHMPQLLSAVDAHARSSEWGAVELRPRAASETFAAAAASSGLQRGDEYCAHRLDLRPDPAVIFRQMHASSTQRAIRRAEREGLTYETGTSGRLLAHFYRLLRMTRRRHGLPPQPRAWFRNLVSCLGHQIAIHLVSKDGNPVASMLTLSFKKTIVYKYGASDAAHHRLGAVPFLFWRVIRDARAQGFEELDLGRSDFDQPGLITFKDHLGAGRSTMTYYRTPARTRDAAGGDLVSRVARGVFAHLPDTALDLAGRLIYKRLG